MRSKLASQHERLEFSVQRLESRIMLAPVVSDPTTISFSVNGDTLVFGWIESAAQTHLGSPNAKITLAVSGDLPGYIIAVGPNIGGNPNFAAVETAGINNIVVIGTNFDDEIAVQDTITRAIQIEGRGGNDLLVGGGGNDTILGGDGNDTILGLTGNDTISGGAGDDILLGGAGNDNIAGDDGTDTIFGFDPDNSGSATESNELRGGAGDDTIVGAAGPNLIFGDSGNDTLVGGAGDDQIAGGTGNDTIQGLDGNDSLMGEGGDDSIVGGVGNDTLSGGLGVDTLVGEGGNDTLDGGDGDDTLVGGDGNDTLAGGGGNDILAGENGDDQLNGGDGNDTLLGDAGNDTLVGGAGDDTLVGGAGNDALSGGTDNDILVGEDGIDTLLGGTGNDQLVGGNGDDTLNGEDGDDVLTGELGDDVLLGGSGNDILIGGAGSDVLAGGIGDDVYVFEPAATTEVDTIFEEQNEGTDIVTFAPLAPETARSTNHSGVTLAVSANRTLNVGQPGQQLNIEFGINIDPFVQFVEAPTFGVTNEPLRFVANVVGVGTQVTHTVGFNFGDGNVPVFPLNEVDGRGTIDITHEYESFGFFQQVLVVVNAFGNFSVLVNSVAISEIAIRPDRTSPPFTALYIGGTTGDDVIHFSSGTLGRVNVEVNGRIYRNLKIDAGVYAFGGKGNDRITMEPALARRAHLSGGNGDDFLRGGAVADTLLGGAGNDVIYGGDGPDYMAGGDGNDRLFGEAGNDILLGETGDDLLQGGTGRDLIIGGEGSDELHGGSLPGVLIGGTTIHDSNRTALEAIQEELRQLRGDGTQISAYVDNLMNGGGANGTFVLVPGVTVFDDFTPDSINAGNGSQLIFVGVGDELLNVGADDILV